MNLENLNLVELNAQEVQEVDGGFLSIFKMTGFLDGIAGNCDAWLFGFKIW
jgi:hypothetical protein